MDKLDAQFHTLGSYQAWELGEEAPLLSMLGEDARRGVEEVRGITWDLEGAKLDPWQGIQRLYLAGFKDIRLVGTFWSVLEAESASYLMAWHHNVTRNADGSIFVSEDGLIEIRSTDLGYIQRNIVHEPRVQVAYEGDESRLFVHDLFASFPQLANGQKSAEIAWELFSKRGFQPWYAHSNGSYLKHMPNAPLALGNYFERTVNRGKGNAIIRR